ncbi:MAG: PEGA domain-containing protein [Bacteroidetes bacterium]|nr:PEGA domain-containing protein [Bacteroidota bacterium]
MNSHIKFLGISIISIFLLASCDQEVSTTPPDPEPGNSKIYVNTFPSGYDIYVNNRITGKQSPDSLVYLDSDSYEIGLKHTLFLDTTITVSVSNDEVRDLGVDLTTEERFFSKVECTSIPAEAEIFIDDSSTGHYTPAVLTGLFPGIHTFSFGKLGYRSKVKSITLKSNVLSSLHINLEDTTQWLIYNTDNSDLVSNTLNAVAINSDVSNVMWIATFDLGVMDISTVPWKNYNVVNSPLPMNYVSKVVVANEGNVLIGTIMGIAEFNNGSWNVFNTSNTAINAHDVNDIGYVEAQLSYITGAVIHPSRFYLATGSGGIITYSDNSWGNLTNVNSNLPSLNTTRVKVKESFQTRFIMVGTDDAGVYIDNGYTGVQAVYNSTNAGFIANRVTALEYEDGTYSLYVGIKLSRGQYDPIGMLYFSSDGNVWQEINLDFSVINVIVDAFETTWVGTNNGIYKLLNHTQKVDHITMENSPLPSNLVFDLVLDRSGNIWCATGRGLVRFKP